MHGIIKFSHENQSLQLDIQSRGESVSQMKRLTNGDVTAVFLIALLSCVDNPFYFMDDCDVSKLRFDATALMTNVVSISGSCL